MKPKTLTLGALATFALLFSLCVNLQSARAAGGLLLYSTKGSSYVNAIQYETFTSPSAHLSYAAVKGERVQIQSAGIVANIPFPDRTGIVPQDVADRMIGTTETLAAQYPQYAKLLNSVGELWKRRLEESKVAQARPAPVAATQGSNPTTTSEGVNTAIPIVKTKSGQTLKNVKITRFEDDKVFISHDEGMGRLLITDIINVSAFPADAKAAIEKVQAAVDAKRKAEADRIAAEKKEQERIAKEEEDKRLAVIEAERKAKEAEEQRLSAEKQESERIAKEAEKNRVVQERLDRSAQLEAQVLEAKAKYNEGAMGDFWSQNHLNYLLAITRSLEEGKHKLASAPRTDVLAFMLAYTFLPNPSRQPFKEIWSQMLHENKIEEFCARFDTMAWCAYIPPSTVRMAGMAERIAIGPYIGRPKGELTDGERQERISWNKREKKKAFSISNKHHEESLSDEDIEYLVYLNELESALYLMGKVPINSKEEHASLISDLLVQAFTSQSHQAFCLREDSRMLWSKIFEGSEEWFPRPNNVQAASQSDYMNLVFLPLVKFSKASMEGGYYQNVKMAVDGASTAKYTGDIRDFYYICKSILGTLSSFDSYFSILSLSKMEKAAVFPDDQINHLLELLASGDYSECAKGIKELHSKTNNIGLMVAHADYIVSSLGDPNAVKSLPRYNSATLQDNGEFELRKFYARKNMDNQGGWKQLVGRE